MFCWRCPCSRSPLVVGGTLSTPGGGNPARASRAQAARHPAPRSSSPGTSTRGVTRRLRATTWHWQAVIGVRHAQLSRAAARAARAPLLAPAGPLHAQPARGASAAQARLALHPPLRGQLERPERPVLGRPADGPRLHAHLRAAASSCARARPTAGRRSSRCGSPSAPTAAARLRPVAEHRAVLRLCSRLVIDSVPGRAGQ